MNENVNPSPTSSNSSAIVFTSPFEDTSGLDVFAQIAASAHPLPVEATLARRSSLSNTSSIVQKSQSQLAQSIYQNQQALRLHHQQLQKRDSFDSTASKFDPRINDDDEDMEDDFDDEEEDFDSNSENEAVKNASLALHLDTSIKEETELDLKMDVDQSMNFQRRRSPSLFTSNESLPQPIYGRRLSAPENVSSGYSARRVIHNICERKRRENIREGFDQLQRRLPAHLANNSKLSKMEILIGAKNLINEIRGRMANLSAEISALSHVKEQIEKKSASTN